MTAPALVALAHGSRDPRSAATSAPSRRGAPDAPDLRIEAGVPRAVPAVLRHRRRPVGAGGVRRDRRRTAAAHRGLPRQGRRAQAIAAATARHEGLRIRADRASSGLEIGVPRGARPPAARRAERGPRPRARRAGARRRRLLGPARQPGRRPARPAVGRPAQAAHRRRRSPPPLRRPPARPSARSGAEGRRHIAVGSLFLAPGFLPDRAAELALEAGAVAVSAAARAPTPRWPAPSSPGTPSAPSSSVAASEGRATTPASGTD